MKMKKMMKNDSLVSQVSLKLTKIQKTNLTSLEPQWERSSLCCRQSESRSLTHPDPPRPVDTGHGHPSIEFGRIGSSECRHKLGNSFGAQCCLVRQQGRLLHHSWSVAPQWVQMVQPLCPTGTQGWGLEWMRSV